MTKPLSSIKNPAERLRVIIRRIESDSKGLGFWGSVDAWAKIKARKDRKRDEKNN